MSGIITKVTEETLTTILSQRSEAEDIIEEILAVYDELTQFKPLIVTEVTKALFFRVYNIVAFRSLSADVESIVLNDARVLAVRDHLRQLMGTLECLYEEGWAEAIALSESHEEAQGILSKYPGFGAYQTMVRMELDCMTSVLSHFPLKIAMLGSGPLPLTVIRLLERAQEEKQNTTVLCTDIDEKRVVQSEKLFAALGDRYSNKIEHVTADARYGPNLKDFDAVYFASLIGSNDQERQDILCEVAGRMERGSVIILRTVEGMKSLLYPSIDLETAQVEEKLEVAISGGSGAAGDHNSSAVICRVR